MTNSTADSFHEFGLTEQIQALLSDHLHPRMADSLWDAGNWAASLCAVGEWPIVASDSRQGDALGLWVLTSERSLWVPKSKGKEATEAAWKDVEAVKVINDTGLDFAIEVSGEGGETLTFHDVGDVEWASELEWTAGNLAALNGPNTSRCPKCLLDTAEPISTRCRLCGTTLIELPLQDLSSDIVARLSRFNDPSDVRRLTPAVEAATLHAAGGDWIWVVSSAELDGEPALLIATDLSFKLWRADGTSVLDVPLGDVSVSAAPPMPPTGLMVEVPATGLAMHIGSVGSPAWVADICERISSEGAPSSAGSGSDAGFALLGLALRLAAVVAVVVGIGWYFYAQRIEQKMVCISYAAESVTPPFPTIVTCTLNGLI